MSTPPLEYMLTLCNLCVICNSNRFHSFIFELKLHIEDVHWGRRSRAESGLVCGLL